jgi:hypothetical protein
MIAIAYPTGACDVAPTGSHQSMLNVGQPRDSGAFIIDNMQPVLRVNGRAMAIPPILHRLPVLTEAIAKPIAAAIQP